MTDTVLDACLCLLLVSAAAVTVVTVPGPSDPAETNRADAVAESLAATTTVQYTLAPGARRADPDLATFERTSGPAFRRRARGSFVSLLARAAVRTVRVQGAPVTYAAADFQRRVVGATRAALPPRTQVVVRWEPYPGSHISRRFTVGPAPPGDADVNAATVRAPSGTGVLNDPVPVARERGFAGLSELVAGSFVAGLVPPAQARVALAGDPPVSTLMRYRYRRLAGRYGTTVDDSLEDGDVEQVNRDLTLAASDEVEADLRTAFDSPEAASRTLDLGTVDVVVRTWSA
jgi:hypothetical protein